MARFLLALALFAGAEALMLSPPAVAMRAAPARVVAKMSIEDAASDCLESGCEIDDVEFLIEELTGVPWPADPPVKHRLPSAHAYRLSLIHI